MAKGKGGGKPPREKKAGGAAYLLDRNIVARIEAYALNNDVTDVDGVVAYLQGAYKEYQRRQGGVLRQMAAKAIAIVQRKGVSKPELRLQVRSVSL